MTSPRNLQPFNLVKTLAVGTAVSVILIAAGAFAISFDALNHLAAEHNFNPQQTFLFPLILDGGIIVFSLSALRFGLCGVDAKYPMLLVIVATVGSILFNVLHASDSPVAKIMATVPPLILFLSFELLMKSIKLEMGMRPVSQGRSNQLPKDRQTSGKPSKSPAMLPVREKALSPATTSAKAQERRQRVWKLREESLDARTIAKNLGVPLSTIYRDLASMKNSPSREEAA